MTAEASDRMELQREREDLLEALTRWLEWPMVLLSIVWLVILIVELTQGASAHLERVGKAIWAIFIVDFVLRFIVAPHKWRFLRANLFTLVTLVIPAVRALRVLRVARAARSVRLVRVIGSVNRSMRSLGQSMQRRGFAYVFGVTIVVLLAGSAGIFAFEGGDANALSTYSAALWWTAMLLTTIGSDYWPVTPEGKALTLILSLYALGILGYVAATLASFFIGREAEQDDGILPDTNLITSLHQEVALLRRELQSARTNDGK
jgi:voltage-gated potassium channel